jgi:polyisoprenoid-binding protein YceI
MKSPITATAPTPALPLRRFRIEPTRTTVRFRTRHLLGLGAVTGTVTLRQASLTVGVSPGATRLRAVLDAASFDTGNPKRDTQVRSVKYLDVTTYPEITFDAHRLRQHHGTWVATGTLTAHCVTAPTDLTLDELHRGAGGELVLRASALIDRYAHRVTAGNGLAARRLTVEITATATPIGGSNDE